MKSNELRIGNVIHFPFHAENVKIVGVGISEDFKTTKIQVETEGSILMDVPSVFKPIPLTEEWLVKFGFEQSKDADWIWTLKIKGYESPWEKITFNTTRKKGWLFAAISANGKVSIENVHQLQNIYYALTGDELTDLMALQKPKCGGKKEKD